MAFQKPKTRRPIGWRLIVALGTAAFALATPAIPVDAGGRGPTVTEAGVGLFYGTFGQSPNILMLVGGKAEDFCEANPDDPFNAEPGVARQRIQERKDGTVRITLKSARQPVHLYEIDFPGAPPWIEQICAGYFADGSTPAPFASGNARVKSRVTIMPDGVVDIYNMARGRVTGTDGTRYRVRGSADFVVEDGMPVGNPEDFVSFYLREIGG